MDENKVKFETTVKKIGDSRYVRIPPNLADHLGFEEGTRIISIADTSKHGKFMATWKAQPNKTLIEKTIKEENDKK